jgi:release factor glutamine methyltransferase
MPEVALSLHSLLDEAAEQLRRAAIPEPRREALRLWTEVCGTSIAYSLIHRQMPVEASTAAGFRRAIQRRSRGEPFSYVAGRVGFRHLSLRIDRRALIPRPETEGLVELLLQRVRSGAVADVGTGSGCIALSLAQEGSFSRIIGIDCSPEALALARANAGSAGSANLVDFVQADLCTSLRPGSLHALISNPPYLTSREYDRLDSSVREWEPAVALSSGSDGMETTLRLMREGIHVLTSGGWLALEIDCTRADAAAAMAGEYGWCDVSIHRDLFGRERYLLARRSETR